MGKRNARTGTEETCCGYLKLPTLSFLLKPNQDEVSRIYTRFQGLFRRNQVEHGLWRHNRLRVCSLKLDICLCRFDAHGHAGHECAAAPRELGNLADYLRESCASLYIHPGLGRD